MNAFFSDLDNTLIYSHRRTITGNRILVERLNGKEQSYMTEYAFSFFREADWLTLIPVTTRSEEQYRRLLLPEVFQIQFALLCNGGKLLVQGHEDPEWTEQTLELVREDLQDLGMLGSRLGDLCNQEVRKPEKYYCYSISDTPERICGILRNEYPKGNIRIEHDHRKIYLFPQRLNKGEALRRFMGKYKINVTVGAGDSIIDIPMLNEVDYPLASASLRESMISPAVRMLTGEIISDQICWELETLHQKGIV